jgi:hypothetical protein
VILLVVKLYNTVRKLYNILIKVSMTILFKSYKILIDTSTNILYSLRTVLYNFTTSNITSKIINLLGLRKNQLKLDFYILFFKNFLT